MRLVVAVVAVALPSVVTEAVLRAARSSVGLFKGSQKQEKAKPYQNKIPDPELFFKT